MNSPRKLYIYKLQSDKTVLKGLSKSKFYSIILLIIIIVTGTFGFSLVASSLMNSVIIGSSGRIGSISPLHVEGRYIKDRFNNTITLKGVNQPGFIDSPDGWFNPEGGGYLSGLGVWDPVAVKYNLDSMKSWGCNVLRLHTKIAWWIDDESSYRQHIKDTIAWAGERGIYVIFEPYCISTATAYTLPWSPHATASEDIAYMPNSAAFIDYWTSVANELAVRATGAEQVLVVQWAYGIWINLNYPPAPPPTPAEPGSSQTMDWVLRYPLNDPLGNIVYSFHNYRGDFHRSSPEYVSVWEYDDVKSALQYSWVDYILNTMNKPILVGEIGASMWESGEGLDQELAYFNNSLTIYNEWGMSYIGWVWDVPAHMQHGLLQNDASWLPPPNEAGEILIDKMQP
jgi:hypothetical protein